MSGTCLNTCTSTGVFVEDVVERAGESRRHFTNTLAGVAVKVLVKSAGLSLIPASTHTLTGFHVQFLIWAAYICREYVCRDGIRKTHTGESFRFRVKESLLTQCSKCTFLFHFLICSGF